MSCHAIVSFLPLMILLMPLFAGVNYYCISLSVHSPMILVQLMHNNCKLGTKKGTYTPWHVHRENENPQTPHTKDQSTSDTPPDSMQMHDWKILSQLHLCYNIEVDDLDMIGYHDFDANHNWSHTTIPLYSQEIAINFVEFNCSTIQNQHHYFQPSPRSHIISYPKHIFYHNFFTLQNPFAKTPMQNHHTRNWDRKTPFD